MVRIRRESILLFWIGIGLLLATVGANRLFASGLVNYRMLYECLIQRKNRQPENNAFSVLLLLMARGAQTAFLAFLCGSRYRNLFCRLAAAFFGMQAGFWMVLLTWSRGAAGLLLFLAAAFPQGICYLIIGAALLLRGMLGYEVRRRKFGSAVLALLSAGILLELTVNPLLFM